MVASLFLESSESRGGECCFDASEKVISDKVRYIKKEFNRTPLFQ